jgi:hypothetical protein
MDTIKFECPHCGNVLMAGADQAGIEAKCPKCGRLVQVPAFVVSVSAAPPRREEPVPAAPTPSQPAAPAAPARKEEAPPAAAAPVRPAPAAPAPPKPEPTGAEAMFAASTHVTFVTDLLLGVVRFIRKAPRCFIGYQKILAAVGAYAVLAAGLFFPLEYIVMAIRFKTARYVFVGLAGAVAALLLHYVAVKFASAGPALVRNNLGRISSRAYLDCCALLALVAAVAVLAWGIRTAIALEALQPFWLGLVLFFIFIHLLILYTNPLECLNVQVITEGTTAGEDALSIVMLVPRVALAMAPILLGYGAAGGAIWMMVMMVKSWASNEFEAMFAHMGFVMAAGAVTVVALAPFAFYLFYLFVALFTDLCSAIFQTARNTAPKK